MVISENCCNFIVFHHKALQATITRIAENEITELFRMADDFCRLFDAMMAKYTSRSDKRRCHRRDSTLSKAEIMITMILSHGPGYRCPEHFLPADARGCHTAHHQTEKQHERSVDKRAKRAATPQEDHYGNRAHVACFILSWWSHAKKGDPKTGSPPKIIHLIAKAVDLYIFVIT